MRLRSGSLLLALFVLGTFAAPQGLVLCVAEGDHIAIETAVELHPCGAPMRDGSNAVGAPPVESCTDTPLLQPSLRSDAGRNLPTPLAAPLSSWLATPRANRPLVRLREGRDGPVGPLRVLRTIVLLV